MGQIEKSVSDCAAGLGFVLIGFAPLKRLTDRADFFGQWIAEGRIAEMEWLKREPERRFEPRTLDSRLSGVVSLAYPYAAPRTPQVDWRAELRGRIAAYALGLNYHGVGLKKARLVAGRLMAEVPGSISRLYVDTGPVFEREWAAAARLGWFGRNTNLISRYYGSYFFLAENRTVHWYEDEPATTSLR
jgi:epoxyqueuosine reductase